jgi:hypothetical protein
MKLLRKTASEISSIVVRHASSGTREWAEAMAREVEEISGDWAALAWALGSLRVLADRRGAKSGAQPRRPALVEWTSWFSNASLCFFYAVCAFAAHGWHARLGDILIALCWAYHGTSSVWTWIEESDAPTSYDPLATPRFYKARLERRLARYRTPRRWLSPLVTLTMCAGWMMVYGNVSTALVVAVLAFTALVVWMQCLDTPAKIEGRIAKMDALIAAKLGAV